MILQAAMAAGFGILVFGGLAFLILTPLMSIFTYNSVKWFMLKTNSSGTELKGARKVILIVGSVIQGIILAVTLISFVFWLVFKDVTFD